MADQFNFTDLIQAAADAGFSVVPADDYDVEVATAEAGKTSTGKNKISVRFKIISGPYAGKSVFNDFVISPENGNALGFFFRHMKVLGLDQGYFATNPPLASAAASLIGRRCVVTVGIRQWQGDDKNEVKGVKPLAGNVVGSAPMMPTPHGPAGFPPPFSIPAAAATFAPPVPPVTPVPNNVPRVPTNAPVESGVTYVHPGGTTDLPGEPPF